MKIAIKANPSRGKEIISLLESFGGIKGTLKGDGQIKNYYIDENHIIRYSIPPIDYKVYTLEEFEKEFPFKIGDEVIFPIINGWASGKITGIKDFEYEVNTIGGYRYVEPHKLSLYPMKEERNITLTLDKAKEWYKKGGELKEIALQAFTENELNSLPKSWEEYCRKYEFVCLSTRHANISLKYDALIKLEQLRDCWRQGNIPRGLKYKIRKTKNKYTVLWGPEDAFLSFCDSQIAEEFLECFRDLIEQAGDLI